MNPLRPDLRAFIEAARNADGPRPEDRARIHHALQQKLRTLGVGEVQPPAELSTPAPRSGAAMTMTAAGQRLLLITLAAGVLGTAAMLWRADSAPAASEPPPPSFTTSSGPSAVNEPPKQPASASSALAAHPASEPAGAPPMAARTRPQTPGNALPRSSPPGAPTKEPPRSRRVATRAVGSIRAISEEPSKRGARADDMSVATTREPVATTRDEASESLPQSGRDLSEELALVGAARHALLEGNSREALRFLAAHADRFANGRLSEERQGLQALALCDQGRTAEGIALRDRFLRDSPHSVLAARVRQICGRSTP